MPGRIALGVWVEHHRAEYATFTARSDARLEMIDSLDSGMSMAARSMVDFEIVRAVVNSASTSGAEPSGREGKAASGDPQEVVVGWRDCDHPPTTVLNGEGDAVRLGQSTGFIDAIAASRARLDAGIGSPKNPHEFSEVVLS